MQTLVIDSKDYALQLALIGNKLRVPSASRLTEWHHRVVSAFGLNEHEQAEATGTIAFTLDSSPMTPLEMLNQRIVPYPIYNRACAEAAGVAGAGYSYASEQRVVVRLSPPKRLPIKGIAIVDASAAMRLLCIRPIESGAPNATIAYTPTAAVLAMVGVRGLAGVKYREDGSGVIHMNLTLVPGVLWPHYRITTGRGVSDIPEGGLQEWLARMGYTTPAAGLAEAVIDLLAYTVSHQRGDHSPGDTEGVVHAN